MQTDKKTKFQLALVEFGVSEETSELAWQQDSWTQAILILRFGGKCTYSLPEIRAMFYVALDLPRSGEEHWEEVGRAWHGRKGKS